MSRKKKLKYESFLEIIKDNSKENPFNIDNYNKQSILDCRLLYLSHFNFYISFTCMECNKISIKNLNRYRVCYISNLERCSNCIRRQQLSAKASSLMRIV